MNLWFRLALLILASVFRARIDPVAETSRLRFRVWPHDLDTSLHLNNGRYWTLMDLGRADLMLRSGIWRTILKHRWVPVINAAKIRFRRELRPFQSFGLESRIVAWGDAWIVMEQRMVSRSRNGGEIVNAVALVRAGLYDRRTKSFVTVERLFDVLGTRADSPEPGPDVVAFLAAEEAMKKAA
jgi:acyl-CoA thioesterase FadM